MQIVQIGAAQAGARGRVWQIERVQSTARRAALLHLANDGDDEARVLVAVRPAEPLSRLSAAALPPEGDARATAAVVRALLRRERLALALTAAARLRGQIHDWQLAAALAFARGHARVLLADAVGMGKTVSAALAIAECLAEGLDRRCLALAPAHLVGQWRQELVTRLGITPTVIDAAGLRRMEQTLPAGLSGWSLPGCSLAPIDFVKQPHIAPALASIVWDLLVIDEAHLVCGDSERHAACALLARRARRLLLLTATPSDGGVERFAALRALGDARDALIMLRHAPASTMGMRRRRLFIAPATALVALHAQLDRYVAGLMADAGAEDGALSLLAALLTRRALSSPHALRLSLERRLALLDVSAVSTGTAAESSLQLSLFEADDDERVLGARSRLVADDERGQLTALVDAAHAAARDDRRLAALERLVSRVREPVVVFTCFRDTAIWLAEALSRMTEARVVHGLLPGAALEAALDSFTHGTTNVLVATDVAAQGLNLHARCRRVIHFDLPWRPSTLRQRDGRVDRLGQSRVPHSTLVLDRLPAARAALDRLDSFAERMRSDDFQSARRWLVLAASEGARLRRARPESAPTHSSSLPCPIVAHAIETTIADGRGGIIERAGIAVAGDRREAIECAVTRARQRARALVRPLAARTRRRVAREHAVATAARQAFAHREIQPGLFDRRATRDTARTAHTAAAIDCGERDMVAAHVAAGTIAAIRLRLVATFRNPPAV